MSVSRTLRSSAAGHLPISPVDETDEPESFGAHENYLLELDKFALPEREKIQWLAALQLIVTSFVDQAFSNQEEIGANHATEEPYD